MGRTKHQLCQNVVDRLNKVTDVENATCTPDVWGSLLLRADVNGNSLYCNKLSYENDCVRKDWWFGCERHAKLSVGYSGEKCQDEFSKKMKNENYSELYTHSGFN